MMMGRWALLGMLFLPSQEERRPFASDIDHAAKTFPGWSAASLPARSDDGEFIRRVWMDLLGQAPSDDEARSFAADPDPKKREKKIDQLLVAPGFGPFWGRRLAEAFLGDLSKARMERIEGVTPEASAKIVNRFAAWLGEQVAKDRPYPEILRDMIEATGKSGDTPALGYKLAHFRGTGYPTEFAMGLSRGLLGIRLYCVQCHDHPFDIWTPDHYYGLAAFVAREKARKASGAEDVELRAAATGELEYDAFDPVRGTFTRTVVARSVKPNFPFWGAPEGGADRVKTLAALVTDSRSDQLSRTLVNRVWAWLFGRGLVHPPDDFNKTIAPASLPLLGVLTRQFVESKHSLKTLIREVCRTQVYQFSDPKGPSEKDATYLRGVRRAWRSRPPSNAMPRLSLPAGWSAYEGPRWKPRPLYRIPDKEKRAGDAWLLAADSSGWWDEVPRQMTPAAPRTETMQGKQAVTVMEVKGTYWCDLAAGAPLENHHAVIARVGPRGWHFRLEGPAETVADWRDEFLELLKGIEP